MNTLKQVPKLGLDLCQRTDQTLHAPGLTVLSGVLTCLQWIALECVWDLFDSTSSTSGLTASLLSTLRLRLCCGVPPEARACLSIFHAEFGRRDCNVCV